MCDEEGNATFVFDNEKLREYNIAHDDLITLTKEDIKDLLEENPTLGQRIVYSNRFVPNVVEAFNKINNKPHDEDEAQAVEGISYLFPKAPDDYLFINNLAEKWKISDSAIRNAISELNDQLGLIEKYNISKRMAVALSPEQQKIIHDHFAERGMFAPEVPDGYYSAESLGVEWGIDSHTIRNAISELKDQLGLIEKYKVNNVPYLAYSPEQQITIHDYLAELGTLTPEAPEGYYSAESLGVKWGISGQTIRRNISVLENQLGVIENYKIGSVIFPAYSPEQQKIIYDHLTELGMFAPEVPDGYYPAKALGKEWGISSSAVYNVISELKDQLGPTEKYRFRKGAFVAYSPEQQKIIHDHLAERGIFAPEAPDGYYFTATLAEKWKISDSAVYNAISELKDQLGPTEKYKSGSRSFPAYSPEQQQIIKDYIDVHR